MAANRKQRRKNRATAANQARLDMPGNPPSQPTTKGNDPRAAKAARLQGDGAYAEADRLWRQILADRPDDLVALQHLGILQLQRPDADLETAVTALARAAELLPTNAPAQMHAGLALQRSGRLDEAERVLRKALEIKPDYAEAHNNLGVTLISQGRHADATAAFQAALNLDPNHSAARRNLDGLNSTTARLNARRRQGEELLQKDQFEAAIGIYRALVQEAPELPEFKRSLAQALSRGRQHEEAVVLLQELLAQNPEDTEARILLAHAHYQAGDYVDALNQLDDIPEYDLLLDTTHHLRANILRYMKRYDAADAVFNKALAVNPDDPKVRNDRGLLLGSMNRSTDASVELLHALTLDPTNWHIYNNLANLLKDQGRMLDALDLYQQAIDKCPPNPLLLSNLVLSLNYIDGLSNEAVFDGHLKYQGSLSDVPSPRDHANDRSPQRRLRVGYISPDFRAHSVARFFSPLLKCHDRENFEVFLYADVASPDKITDLFRARADGWRDIRNKTADQVADLVRSDQVDILIDLSGHTGGNRLEVLHRKPAPVQASWLGYPNTTGLDAVDYRIVDEITEPTGEAEAYSVEAIVRLPDGFHCMEAFEDSVTVAPPPHEQNGFIRFGSFNYLAKVTDRVVATWAEILKQVPDSRLLMKARGLGDTLANDSYLSQFEKHGIARERIEIAPYQPTQRDHLNLYGMVDIALDTFPYNGTTTTCEALWMGVPVIALMGHNHASRVSASLLTQVGHPELIAADAHDYVARAVELAHDQPRMRQLRAGLRSEMQGSPLRDEPGFARKFEAALREMWITWCRQDAPAAASTDRPGAVVKTGDAPVPSAEMAGEVRVLHHLARTGGTLISKCLASMDDVVLLSEVHPDGASWIDPFTQAQDWFGLIDAEEARQLRAEQRPFETLIALCAARCESAGKTLIVRDWTHLDYTGVPFAAPGYTLKTLQRLSETFDRVHATATVRHPIDQWLSLDRLSLIHGRLSIGAYLRGYRAFAEDIQDIGFVRYEDFTADPDTALQTLCRRLNISFDPGYRTRWPDYTKITGDVVKNDTRPKEIRPSQPKRYPSDLRRAFEDNPDYAPALELLGYPSDWGLPEVAPVPADASEAPAAT
jgi:predicted O-linked N-acetylglucosamine transferase (SPINDLY family)